MFLVNTELEKLLPSLNISVANDKHPFESKTQIKTCGIELRLSDKFWRQSRHPVAINLLRKKLLTTSPKNWWKKERKHKSDFKDPVVLYPGEMLLAQTHEKISIPENCIGKIITDENFARLGVHVTCMRDTLMPGWRGQLALEIVNNSIHAIQLYPLLSVCQLAISKLSKVPERKEEKVTDHFFDDAGGPYYWWRQHLIHQLNQRIKKKTLKEEAVAFLKDKVNKMNGEGVFRFDRFLMRTSFLKEIDAENSVKKFCRRERMKKFMSGIWRLARILLLPVFFVATIALLSLVKPVGWPHYIAFAATIISLYPVTRAVFEERTIYYPSL